MRILVVRILLLLFLGQVAGCTMSQGNVVSNLKSDERIVFFTTDARFSADQNAWIVPIHAWVHELDNAAVRRKAVSAALNMKYDLEPTADTKSNFDRRIRLIVADNERGKQIVIDIAGSTITLPKTEANGHARLEITLDAALVQQHAHGNTLTYSASLRQGDDRKFTGTVNLISPTGLSVISDFDDTVKITYVTDRGKMLDHALLRAYQAIPGMPEQYASWSEQGVAFHFVSSSPWHLYEPIDEFMDASGFPPRSMQLKHFRFKDSSLMNLFKKGTETKPDQIASIVNSYPARRFLLIGDSGEHDPEVYAESMRRYPKQILRIYIHNVTGANRSDQRFSKVFDDIDPAKWSLFDDPKTLELPE